MSLLLRAARPGESDVLFGLHRETTLLAYRHIFPPERYPFPDEAMREHWHDVVAGHGGRVHVTVAELDGEVVGAVVARPGVLEKCRTACRPFSTASRSRTSRPGKP